MWNRMLMEVDDMSRLAVSRVICEKYFKYDYTWRTKNEVFRSIVACLVRAQVSPQIIIHIYNNLFEDTWLKGLDHVVLSIIVNLEIPYLEDYVIHPLGSLLHSIINKRPILHLTNQAHFNLVRPNMYASIQFLLQWRGIIQDDNIDWIVNYLLYFGY